MTRIKNKRARKRQGLKDVDNRVFRTEREQREAKKFAKRELHTTNRRHTNRLIQNEDWDQLHEDDEQ